MAVGMHHSSEAGTMSVSSKTQDTEGPMGHRDPHAIGDVLGRSVDELYPIGPLLADDGDNSQPYSYYRLVHQFWVRVAEA
ncbi:hypothetical protein SMACR_09457 [Sordaria macrospora]|uniref:WGS project CABT00000000 data, contig 2.92 n=2 Tax=Sordaria macrospora TaxID=5147 RepID=F7WC24_SORMK|nr:uncharacterized protein SMAC_09457 [Sordaria macrospora k-hell]KAA8622089.1 hypothetical protein SMACR_09457 [Sordaria macrospora]KAH7631529.1 hypothetical protein B0T09DRAFT_261136 [Sordaria sp. MPI-SDFR-AT-0083]WPJ62853.1 hypothetical protein SMAC4_09457 [Sordaria macrospora]CCC05527.1 unnamed protein product [Sordaria macrospora k-hell]